MPNDKENVLYQVVDTVVSCCATRVKGERMSVTPDDVLGTCRKENVVLTRQIVAGQLNTAGYTISTIADLLGRSEKSVRNILREYYANLRSNYVFKMADAESTLKCKPLWGGAV